MMLSDELLRIGSEVDINFSDSVDAAVLKMFDLCYKDTLEKIGTFQDDKTIISSFRRTNWIWNDTRKKLNNAGLPFMSEDGFKTVICNQGLSACELFGESYR
jgi:hypothetical protein